MKFLLQVFILCLLNCTTIGFHNNSSYSKLNFGAELDYTICILQDSGISDSRVESIVSDLKEELKLYNINLKVGWQRPWVRPSFWTGGIIRDVEMIKLEKPCDRIMAFVSRSIFDFILAIPLPEILGAVETNTHTRGMIYADYLTPNIILLGTPSRVLIHENYHFLGCDHDFEMTNCYDSILLLKKSSKIEKTFFHTFSWSGKILKDRESTNQILNSSKED
ncbi:MAG: hypothetical protein SFU98_12615 [Leptospiraceae bacterium]|nr:hypothetical protein [Leptospiraceae bacterium]